MFNKINKETIKYDCLETKLNNHISIILISKTDGL